MTSVTPPTLDDIPDQTTAELAAVSIPVVGADPDVGDALVLSIRAFQEQRSPTTVMARGLIEWTPDLDDSGSYAVTVELSDGVHPPAVDSFTLDVAQTRIGVVPGERG